MQKVAKDLTPHIYVVPTLLTHPANSNIHLFGELAPSFYKMRSNHYFNGEEESNFKVSRLINQNFLSGLYNLTSQHPSLHVKKNLPRNQINNGSANSMFCLLIHQKHYLKSFIIDSDSWWEAGRRKLYNEYSFVFHLLA